MVVFPEDYSPDHEVVDLEGKLQLSTNSHLFQQGHSIFHQWQFPEGERFGDDPQFSRGLPICSVKLL